MNTDRCLRQQNSDIGVWEGMWAPYDEVTYQAVLMIIQPDDVVLDIGAGDLRLARRVAYVARKVYAIEMHKALVDQAIAKSPSPKNLMTVVGDARWLSFPEKITCGILLMRHCTYFRLYVEKLKAIGAQRLITNARWGMGVETIWLQGPRITYQDLDIGWYACWCGATGFKPGPAEHLIPEVESCVYEVQECPECGKKKGK